MAQLITISGMSERAGDRLVANILADIDSQGLRPDAREAELLERARVLGNRLERLEAAIERGGETYRDKNGVIHPSRLLCEVRTTTAILARVLSGVQMSAPDNSKNVAKVRAGQASWAARQARAMLKDA